MTVEIEVNNQESLPDFLVEEFADNKLIGRILFNRGIDTPAKLEQFLDLNSYTPTNPFEFPNLEQAIEIILAALDQNEKIAVYGDYDVDGVTSTAILVHSLKEAGANVSYHIPDRITEGYGMNKDVIRGLADDDIDLIITCDCGISNRAEVALAKELGMKVVVTDHHHLPEKLPEADSIVTPKFLDSEHLAYQLPGAGMAYYLALALFEKLEQRDKAKPLIELVALAVVADVMPLRGENRYLLKKGLNALATTDWLGIEVLCKQCDLDLFNLSAEDIGFQIAPRINATGRIDNASKAVELLLSDDRARAVKLAKKLEQINQERKEISNRMEQEALDLLNQPDGKEPIVLYKSGWHQGVVGIVAGRLSEKYRLPSLLMCLKEDNSTITGSARSIPGVHIYEILSQCQELLEGFGGHAEAAGFSLLKDNLAPFKARLKSLISKELESLNAEKKIRVDGELDFDELSLDFYQQLQTLAPYGEKNPKPLFYTSQVEIASARPFTSGSQHFNLLLDDGKQRLSAIWWRADEDKLGEKVDVVYSVELNEWRGKRELQLNIKEVINRTGEFNKDELKIKSELKDYRNFAHPKQELPKFRDVAYYYEGIEKSGFDNVVDRYTKEQVNNLVLLTCPPSYKVLTDLIIRTEAEQLILAFSRAELVSAKSFLKLLLKILKSIITKKSGKTSIYKLASLTGQGEKTIFIALQYLRSLGYINFEFINPSIIFVRQQSEKDAKQKDKQKNEQKLKQLFKETISFKKYMLEKDIEQINDLINS